MLRLTILIACIFCVAKVGTAVAAPLDVSNRPVVKQDLQLAVDYWHTVTCPHIQVIVEPMTDAIGNLGANLPASGVWGETQIGACTIYIAPGVVKFYGHQQIFCNLITHEYGHTIGLPDSDAPMMNQDVTTDKNPYCKGIR
jgi:hypothetical protein